MKNRFINSIPIEFNVQNHKYLGTTNLKEVNVISEGKNYLHIFPKIKGKWERKR